nr:hypothetical protein [Tanacetum cinerariifolium]
AGVVEQVLLVEGKQLGGQWAGFVAVLHRDAADAGA